MQAQAHAVLSLFGGIGGLELGLKPPATQRAICESYKLITLYCIGFDFASIYRRGSHLG